MDEQKVWQRIFYRKKIFLRSLFAYREAKNFTSEMSEKSSIPPFHRPARLFNHETCNQRAMSITINNSDDDDFISLANSLTLRKKSRRVLLAISLELN